MMNLKPIGKRILVEVNKEVKTESGIILSQKDNHRDESPMKVKVLAVSDEIKGIKEGDTIIINRWCGNTVEKISDTLSHRMIKIEDVLLVVEGE